MKEMDAILIGKHPTLDITCMSNGWIFHPRKPHSCAPIYTKGCLNKKGYYVLQIDGKQYRVNRLIAETFLPNPENKPTVDHINRDRTDNSLGNLRWATLSEQKNNSSLVINRLDLGVRRSEDSETYTIAWRDYAHRNIYMYGPVRHWRNTHKEWRKAHWKEVQQHCKECRGRRHKE